MNIDEKIKVAESETEVNLTEKQKSSGDYLKGVCDILGLKISIENPAGSIRSGIDSNGKKWSNKMLFSYGFINNTLGSDGDEVDIFINKNIPDFFDVFVVNQKDVVKKSFDEHKIMFGFKDKKTAKEAYLSCYEKNWKGFESIVAMSLFDFKNWVFDEKKTNSPALEIKTDFKNEVSENRIKNILLDGEVLEGETLKDLQEQAGKESDFDTLVLEIASPGGSVDEGLSIMVWLDKLSQMGKDVVTAVSANAYSIASLIMLAADYRLVGEKAEIMVHNPMVAMAQYANADELEKYASDLRDLENSMYEIYQIFTGLEKDTIKNLMDNETYLSPQDAVKYGFADKIVNMNPRPFSMVKTNQKKPNMSKIQNALRRITATLNGAAIVNQMYYTSDGGSIEVFQNDPANYKVGDKTDMESGTFELANGTKLIVEDYKVTAIDNVVEVKQENAETPAAEPETTEEKEVVVEAMEEEMVEKPVDPKKPEDEKEVEETVAEFNEGAAPVEPIEAENMGEKDDVLLILEGLKEAITLLQEKVEKLQESNDSQMKAAEDQEKKMKSFEAFEEVASEAIEALAGAKTTNFKPAAKVAVESTGVKKSIFQTAKANALARKG